MELLGPSAAGLCMLGIGICLYFVLAAGHVRIPDDPPEVDVELDELYTLRLGDSEPVDDAVDEPEPVELQSVA